MLYALQRLAARASLPLLGLALGLPNATWADDRTGEQIYARTCAGCHGAQGQGVKPDYPKALAGDKSVAQLTKLIARTMPEDDPGSLAEAEAERVAAYIHETFYSPLAQARNRPARVELSRLTVRQYRNSVADLIASFRGTGARDTSRQGLQAAYFKGRNFGGKAKVAERLDPQVQFNFGLDVPVEGDGIEPHEFSIRWEGTLLAPDTGAYTFTVHTDHATRLWVNDRQTPLIDAWVKSGSDTAHSGTITLLGGRAYAIKLEFSKAKQGVNDADKFVGPPRPVPASIRLEWTRPGHTAEVVPSRLLAPGDLPPLFVSSTPFPPDDRSVGYERGTSVSEDWDRATTEAAIEAAGHVAERLNRLANVKDDDPERAAKLKAFCRTFAERAFRRPLSDDLAALYVERPFAEASDPALAAKRVVMLVLKSPRFLYHDGPQIDAYETASRLSFALWDSIPDAPLLEAAGSGQLATREQVETQARRMLGDLRARSKVREFVMHWLRVGTPPDLSKDPEKFPGFDPVLVSDLRTSLELALDEVLDGDADDFRRLFTLDTVPLNGRLAAYYGADLPADAPFTPVKLNPDARSGVLSHPYLMATFAYTGASSPIHRGVFLSRSVLGRSLRPPPVAVAPLAPDLHPDLTTRERVTLQTSPTACQTCHNTLNPLGFALEQFDAVGRFRTEERGRPVDATGTYTTPDGTVARFAGARELAAFLSGSDEVHGAFVEQLFHHLVKQPVRAYGPTTGSALRSAFAAKDFRIRPLMVEIVTTAALPPAPAVTASTAP